MLEYFKFNLKGISLFIFCLLPISLLTGPAIPDISVTLICILFLIYSFLHKDFNWLRENGHGDLIKNQVSLEFGMRQDNEAKALVEELKQKGLAVQQKTSVHPSSLRGFVREQISELGKDVPAELFGTYVANKTKITTKE